MIDLTASVDAILTDHAETRVFAISNQLVEAYAVWFNGYEQYSAGGQQYAGADPVLLVKETDLDGITRGDLAYLDNEWYFIRNVEPDGTGMTMITLSKQNPDNTNQTILIDHGAFTATVTSTIDGGSFTSTPSIVIDAGGFA